MPPGKPADQTILNREHFSRSRARTWCSPLQGGAFKCRWTRTEQDFGGSSRALYLQPLKRE